MIYCGAANLTLLVTESHRLYSSVLPNNRYDSFFLFKGRTFDHVCFLWCGFVTGCVSWFVCIVLWEDMTIENGQFQTHVFKVLAKTNENINIQTWTHPTLTTELPNPLIAISKRSHSPSLPIMPLFGPSSSQSRSTATSSLQHAFFFVCFFNSARTSHRSTAS